MSSAFAAEAYACGCGVVEALIEEGPGLLAGGGVEVKLQAVEGEDRGELW